MLVSSHTLVNNAPFLKRQPRGAIIRLRRGFASTRSIVYSAGIGFLGVLAVIVEYLFFDVPIQGWASLMVVALIFSGTQLLILGLLGEYLGSVYLTLNERPQYIVREVIGPAQSSADASPTSES